MAAGLPWLPRTLPVLGFDQGCAACGWCSGDTQTHIHMPNLCVKTWGVDDPHPHTHTLRCSGHRRRFLQYLPNGFTLTSQPCACKHEREREGGGFQFGGVCQAIRALQVAQWTLESLLPGRLPVYCCARGTLLPLPSTEGLEWPEAYSECLKSGVLPATDWMCLWKGGHSG